MTPEQRKELEALRSRMDRIIAEYKTPGKHETYGPYREGMADCADIVCTALESLLAKHTESEKAESDEDRERRLSRWDVRGGL